MADEGTTPEGNKKPEDDDESPPKNKIKVTVKTPKDKEIIEVEEDASVKDVSRHNLIP